MNNKKDLLWGLCLKLATGKVQTVKEPVKLKKLMIDAGVERAMRASMPVIRKEETVFFAVGLRAGECCRDSGNDAQMIVRFCGEWPCADMKKSIRLKQIRRILS